MEKIIFRVLIIASARSLSEKHIFFQMQYNWRTAQEFCKTYHTDLSPISNKWEEEAFRRSVSNHFSGWIGYYRELTTTTSTTTATTTITTNLTFSGVGQVSYENWEDRNLKLPNVEGESKAYWISNGWILQPSYTLLSFFCMSLKVEQKKKSWEEAVEHCRESYTDLTSLLSETEIQLAQNHMRRYEITEPVWIGLRYLGDLWLWVNGDPQVYTAWSPNRDTRCPVLNHCGALTEEGHWEERDCLEKLKFICI